jgi:hypothetical protein
MYSLVLKGEGASTRERLLRQPWVKSVALKPVNGTTELEVSTIDEGAAEACLLRMALDDPGTIVTEFGRHKYDLEEVFVQLVEGGSSNVNSK